MPARSISTCTISFGLVSIPVKLFSTAEPSSSLSFNMLHEKCGTRLKQQLYCPTDSEVVTRSEVIKGYEFQKGKYVTFTQEEIKSLEAEGTGSVEITEFVPQTQVDAVYYSKSYYLGPDKGGDRAYKLLSRAMVRTGRVALAKYAARGKQYLVMVRPMTGLHEGLVLQQLFYSDEIKTFAEVPLGDGEPKPGELELAVQLVEQIAQDKFRPDAYEDEVKKRVGEQIQRKIDGQQIQAAPAPSETGQIVDLMEALKASLTPAGQSPERRPPKRVARKAGSASATKKSKQKAKQKPKTAAR